jgi:flavin-dependent dehydrogenase
MTAVVGGGPAGAAAACWLARGGHDVTLYEREAGPAHKVCGDFLSGEALRAVAALGVDAGALGAAPITRARLIAGRHVATGDLPFAAAGLSRRALDEALLTAACASGATVLRGAGVRGVRAAAGGLHVEGPDIADARVLLATGKHALRGAPRPARPGDLVGFKTYLALTPVQTAALRGHVEVVLYDGGYAGLQLVERDHANLCLLANRALLAEAGGYDALIAMLARAQPHLARRLDGAVPLLARPLAIAGLAYGYVHRPRADDPAGLLRLGDQGAVIPSLTGDGVSIALHTGRLAASAVAGGADAAAYHARLARDLRAQVRRAHALHGLFGTATGRALAVHAARAFPRVITLGARATRIPAAAERRAGGTFTEPSSFRRAAATA